MEGRDGYPCSASILKVLRNKAGAPKSIIPNGGIHCHSRNGPQNRSVKSPINEHRHLSLASCCAEGVPISRSPRPHLAPGALEDGARWLRWTEQTRRNDGARDRPRLERTACFGRIVSGGPANRGFRGRATLRHRMGGLAQYAQVSVYGRAQSGLSDKGGIP